MYNKYLWNVILKDEKGITISKTSQVILDEYGRKPNKMWVNKGIKF